MTRLPDRRNSFIRSAYAKVLWLARHEAALLIALIMVTGGTWGFAKIAQEVFAGDTQKFDEWAIRSLRQPDNLAEPIGPHWLKIAALDATSMGGTVMLVLTTFFVGLFLLMEGKWGATILVFVAAGGGEALSLLMKHLFNRPRPSVVPHLSEVMTTSFPSGHSMMSAAVYLTLGVLLTKFISRLRTKIYVLFVAFFLTAMVGATRVYLGVHYPTDVLAGWTAGLVWATLCWAVATYLQRKGKVEQPGMEAED